MTRAASAATRRLEAELRRRHGAGLWPIPCCASRRRPPGCRLREQAAGRLGDSGVSAYPRGVRGGGVLAYPDRNAESSAIVIVRCARLLHLDRLQEATGRRPRRLGQEGARRNAKEHHCPAPGILGRGYPRAGLRLGGDRPGPGGVQPASGRQVHRRPGPATCSSRVPASRAAHGGGFRGQPPAECGRCLPRRRTGRRNDLLPAAPQRLWPKAGCGRSKHPLRPVLQSVGFGSCGAPGCLGSRWQASVGAGRWRRRGSGGDGRRRGAPQDVEPASRPESR